MGDGINDAPALYTADVGVSVDQAVDVARETADIVVLERNLEVLRDGVIDGRRTFANTLKYVAPSTRDTTAPFRGRHVGAGRVGPSCWLPMETQARRHGHSGRSRLVAN